MVMGWFLSVVIDIINILRAVVKTENHPPVGAYGNRLEAFHLAFKRMQPQPRLVQVGNRGRGMNSRQNIPQRLGVFRIYPPRVILFEKPFQPPMANGPYHAVP